MQMLGISIYPDQAGAAQNKAYLDLAYQLGYRRVFTSLIQLENDSQLANFKDTVHYARDMGFKVIVDINPALFTSLGVTYDDLGFFHELGVWGLRLDEGFSGREEAAMTRNQYHLKIEINMSAGTNYVHNIMSYAPNTANLLGCHNFYPQTYTGLSDAYFDAYSRPYRELNLHTAAFVSAVGATLGPWPVREGLPSREADRNRPLAVQVQTLVLGGLIDDIIIGNAFATESQLREVAQAMQATHPQLHIEFRPMVTALEREITLALPHLYRGDASEYLLRDTAPRVRYADRSIPEHDTLNPLRYGDVVVVNDNYARYKGELQIVLSEMPNDGRRNVIGRIAHADLAILRLLKPWSTFQMLEA